MTDHTPDPKPLMSVLLDCEWGNEVEWQVWDCTDEAEPAFDWRLLIDGSLAPGAPHKTQRRIVSAWADIV